MSMKYSVRSISIAEKERVFERLKPKLSYDRKANLFGTCIKLYTNDRNVKESWEDNFYAISETVKSHGRVIAFYKKGGKQSVLYEPYTHTAILTNVGYYGFVKSIALGVAGDILEDQHETHSVHGAAIDVDGQGVGIIAPSGAGKTTHVFGLLQMPRTRFVSDDWYFVRIFGADPLAYSSEKNSYIRQDIGSIWPQFAELVKKVRLDEQGRAVADIRWVVGREHFRESTTIRKLLLLKRDRTDKQVVRDLTRTAALRFLLDNHFCNPHLLVNNARKLALRTRFFNEFLGRVDCSMVNTVLPPMETQDRIRTIVRAR
jgi:hypothetical protein